MRTVRVCSVILAFSLSFATMYGQTQQVASIDSSYPVTIPAGSALSFSTVSLSVSYPTGLTPGSYISGTQLNKDFQTFLAAYPNQTDPPEAILSTVLQSILSKYSQMTGGTLTGEISGSETVDGVTIPVPDGGGTVIVAIGTYNLGALGLSRHPVKPKPVKSTPH